MLDIIETLVVLGLTVAGALALLNPRWVRAKSRWSGLGFWSLTVVISGLKMIINPGPLPAGASPNDLPVTGAIAMVLFGAMAAGFFKLASRAERGKSEEAGPSWMDRQREKAASLRVEQDRLAADRKEAKRKKEEDEAACAAILAEVRARLDADDGMSVDERLAEKFDELQCGEIELEEYAAALAEEGEDIELRLQALLEEKPGMDPDDYEADLESIQEDMEAVRWRLDWMKKKQWVRSVDSTGIAERGKWARFTYSTTEGAESKREIVNWEKRGAYVVGYDRSKEAERTFRQDRIANWQAG